MKLTKLFESFLGIATVSAMPTSSRHEHYVYRRTLNTTQQFLIRTSVVANQSTSLDRFNNLYLSTYHTGAGTNDAILTPDPSLSPLAHTTNTSSILFSTGPNLTYSLQIVPQVYAAWFPVVVNAGAGSGFEFEFVVDDGGRIVWNETGFDGWMVCDWSHGVPQIWARVAWGGVRVPEGCAGVDLRAGGV